MTTNPLLRANTDSCVNCGHPIMRSFLGFDVLPLVEFQPDESVGSHEEALRLIQREPPLKVGGMGGAGGDGWEERRHGGAETLTFNDGGMDGGDVAEDLFVQKMLDAASYFVPGDPYRAVRVDMDTLMDLRPEEVYIVDFRKYSPLLPVRYFRNMIPEMQVSLCRHCGHFYHQETWELEYLQTRSCPFFGSKDVDPTQSGVFTVASKEKPGGGGAVGHQMGP